MLSPAISLIISPSAASFSITDAPGCPRQEIVPSVQISDIQDAITYTSTRDDVDATKIWVWEAPTAAVMRSTSEDLTKESGRSSARCLRLMGKEFQRLVRPDFAPGLYATFEKGTAFCDSMVWACQLM